MSIVITGNPGVGKHTAAKMLAKKMKCSIFDLNKIAIESGLFEKREESLEVDIENLKKIIKKKITSNSVIVGHLAPYVLTKSQVKTVIILRKSPYKLVSIYKKRKYSEKKIFENLGSEVLGIIAHDSFKTFGKKKSFQIDTTFLSGTKILPEIQKAIDGKLVDEKIDWLKAISKKNDFKKFFPY